MKLTYGEAIFQRRKNLDFTQSIEKLSMGLYKQIPKKMCPKKAMKYYKEKLNRVWESVA
jgi:hypothetical protein